MNLNFYSLPCAVKAVLYDGTNHEEVVQIIKLNQGNARWLYLDKNNRAVEKDIITEQKGIWFRANGNGKEEWMIAKDTYVIMDGEQGQVYPCDKEMFEQFHTENGRFSYKDGDGVFQIEATPERFVMKFDAQGV